MDAMVTNLLLEEKVNDKTNTIGYKKNNNYKIHSKRKIIRYNKMNYVVY